MIPGMIVLPLTSMRRASAGTWIDADGPTATMRLPSIRMVAFSITPGVPAIGPGFSPAIVIDPRADQRERSRSACRSSP